jgi:adenine-specific DNA-methyltransferase
LAAIRDELKVSRLVDLDTRNQTFFEEEVEKLERWAEDVKFALEQELKELDVEIRSARKASKAGVTLAEKVEAQRAIKALDQKRTQKRRQLFDAQDDVDRKRSDLIEGMERQLKSTTQCEPVMTFRWVLVGTNRN